METGPMETGAVETGAMGPVRPLRIVLDELTGMGRAAADVDQALFDAGHTGLAPDLLTEAIVSFAAVAPPALAEHLAPFVMATSPAALDDAVTGPDAGLPPLSWGFDLIGTAAAEIPPDPDSLDDLPHDASDNASDDASHDASDNAWDEAVDDAMDATDDAMDATDEGELDFGAGQAADAGLDADPGDLDGGWEQPTGTVPGSSLAEHPMDPPQVDVDQSEPPDPMGVGRLGGDAEASVDEAEEDFDLPPW